MHALHKGSAATTKIQEPTLAMPRQLQSTISMASFPGGYWQSKPGLLQPLARLMRFIGGMIKMANRAGTRPGIGKAQAAALTLNYGKPQTFALGGLIRRFDQWRPLIAATQVAMRFFPFDDRPRSSCDGRRLGKEEIHPA